MEWVLQDQMINQKYYTEVRKKRPDLWSNNSWILHQDNAPAHNALSFKQLLSDKRIIVLEHPPYSTDLNPCDFFMLPNVKCTLKGL